MIKDKSKRKRLIILLLAVLVFLIILGFIAYSPLRNLINGFLENYLSFIERIANWFLQVAGSKVSILDHHVLFRGEVIYQYEWIAKKKWVVALLILFWITPTYLRRKLIFSGLLLLVNFTGSVLDVSLTSHLVSFAPDEWSARLVGYFPHLLLLLTLMTTWIWRERKRLLQSLSGLKINLGFVESKLPEIFVVIFLYALIGKFLYGCFQFTPWINFLFHSSAGILKLLNFQVYVESHNLIGENGSIYMARPCLGLNTLMLFAGIVYITGKNSRTKWLFMLFGIIFLNIVNIVRFVLLFIHIQKHGGYVMSMDLHDMYNLVIYVIVFLLWIFWFEKYSDIREIPQEERNP